MDKEDVVHIYKEILLIKWNNAIWMDMDGPGDYHTCEVSHKEKDKYDITYVWNLKYDTNELVYET